MSKCAVPNARVKLVIVRPLGRRHNVVLDAHAAATGR
jgi:hypothetical protein